MSDNAEYNSLVNRRAAAQRKKDACESRIENCDELLRRLRRVRDEVFELKRAFKDDVRSPDKKLTKDLAWQGYTRDDFENKLGEVITTNEAYYKESLDYVLDSLNNEITRISNERLEEYGLLGELAGLINSLGNAIRNFFN